MTEAEIQESLREKVRTLENYMVEIAQTVIKDSEQSAGESEAKAPSAFRYSVVALTSCTPVLITLLHYPSLFYSVWVCFLLQSSLPLPCILCFRFSSVIVPVFKLFSKVIHFFVSLLHFICLLFPSIFSAFFPVAHDLYFLCHVTCLWHPIY